MFKRCLLWLLCIVIVTIPISGFAANNSVSAIIKENGVILTGNADNEGVPVTLILIKAENDNLNLDVNSDKIIRMAQTVSREHGLFSFDIGLSDSLKGVDLIARIMVAGQEKENVSIHILSDDELLTIYEEFIGLSEWEDVRDFVETNKDNLSLNLSLLEGLCRPQDVYNQMLALKSTVTSAQKIAEIFSDACRAQKEIERQETLDKAAIEALNQSTKTSFLTVLNNFNDRYGLDIESEYGFKRVKKAGSESIYNVWKKVYNQTTIDNIKKNFDEAVATEVINVVSRTEMEAAVKANSSYFDKMLKGVFGSLSDANKGKVYRDAEIEIFISTQEINDWFETKAAVYQRESKREPSGGGGSSSGKFDFYVEAGTIGVGMNPQTPQEENKTNVFNDLTDVPWALDAVENFAERGIVSGVNAGVFAPNREVKREEFVKMLVLSFDLMVDYAVPTFEDVTRGDWFYPYVASAQKQGVVTGESKERFNAGSNITRQDIAVLIYRVLKLNNQLPKGEREYIGFEDEADIAVYAKDAVKALYQAGIINGFGNGKFAPKESATRAQAVKMLYESLQ